MIHINISYYNTILTIVTHQHAFLLLNNKNYTLLHCCKKAKLLLFLYFRMKYYQFLQYNQQNVPSYTRCKLIQKYDVYFFFKFYTK